MKSHAFYWLKYWIANHFKTQPVYLLQYTRYTDTTRYNIILSIGLFGIHFTQVQNCGYDNPTDYVRNTLDAVWKSFYNASPELIYSADDALLKINKNLHDINGIKLYLVSSPKIVNNNKLI